MKIKLVMDEEVYPVIVTNEKWGEVYDLPKDIVVDFLRIEREWFDMQNKIEELTAPKSNVGDK